MDEGARHRRNLVSRNPPFRNEHLFCCCKAERGFRLVYFCFQEFFAGDKEACMLLFYVLKLRANLQDFLFYGRNLACIKLDAPFCGSGLVWNGNRLEPGFLEGLFDFAPPLGREDRDKEFFLFPFRNMHLVGDVKDYFAGYVTGNGGESLVTVIQIQVNRYVCKRGELGNLLFEFLFPCVEF